jgi:prepilin-type N-terminal cleavage/methylation domain-containing protein
MAVRFGQNNKQKAGAGFTLVEVVMSIAILALVMGGMLCGYIQTNQWAEWSSLSLAAQSFASQWAEQTQAEKWDTHTDLTGTGYGTSNELLTTNYTRTNSMLIPGTGQSVIVTNYVSITSVCASPQVRQIRVDCVWQFPLTAIWTNHPAIFSNTVITWRGAR